MERYDIDELGCMSPRADGDYVYHADAQRALDAEREKVKELVANQAEYEKCTDEQITALNQGCLDYEKQIATPQAQLAALRHDYAQLKEAYDAKESGVPLGPVVGAQTIVNQQREINRLQAQLRHMTKERDIQKEVADNQAWHVRQLRQAIEHVHKAWAAKTPHEFHAWFAQNVALARAAQIEEGE